MNAQEFGRCFLPGTNEVHPEVLAAMAQPIIPHRGKEMVDLLAQIDRSLRSVFRTQRPVFVGTCSATGFMEMGVRCGVRRRALCLIGGAYGDRFAGIVAATGRQAVRLNVPLGCTVEPDMLGDAIKRSDVDAVTLVHSESSTGALAPLEELAAVVREFEDVVLLVDAASSLGGSPVETDAWGLDFAFSGSQGALGLPPGLALGTASERLVDRARSIPERGAYLDLVTFAEAAAKHQPANTPAVPLLFALKRQLERIDAAGGVRNRWLSHDAMRGKVEEWVNHVGGDLGFEHMAAAGRRSWTISCLHVPAGASGRGLVKAVAESGWVIGSGYGRLKGQTIRIGHMGDHTMENVEGLLTVLTDSLS